MSSQNGGDKSKFVIFVIDNCPFSERAKRLMRESKYKYSIINVPKNQKDFYKKAHQMSTFPQVFYHTKGGTIIKVGGCDDLDNLMMIIQNTHRTIKKK